MSAAVTTAPMRPPGIAVARCNPFVPMAWHWRIAIVAYVLLWQMFPPILSKALHGTEQEYLVWHMLLAVGVDLLLLVPFLVRRLAAMPTGWLHPLVFPMLMAWAMGLVRTPQTLLYPFLVWFEPVHAGLSHPLLDGWSAQQISLANLKVEALTALSLVSLYAGFLMFSLPVPTVHFSPPRYMRVKLFAVLGVLVLLFLWLIQSSGGLAAHIASFGLGRQRALEGEGHLVGLIRFAPVVLILWYAFDRRVLRRPWYLAILFGVLAMQFMASGSRSATMMPLILLLAVWVFHHQRIPMMRVVVLGVVGLIMIGMLGQIRTSSFGGKETADFSALTDFNPIVSLEAAREEIGARNRNNAALPTIAFVGDQVPLLGGRTYVAALAFFIPSAIWEGKPRGAGAHVGAMVFGNHTLEEAKDYKGGGIPPGAVAEAYWNFHVPGVIFIYMLFGAFKRWLAKVFLRYRHEPAAVGFYLFSIFALSSPATIVLTGYFRNTVFLGALYYFLGVLRIRRRRVRPARYAT